MNDGYSDVVRKDGRRGERVRYQTKDYMLATYLSCLWIIKCLYSSTDKIQVNYVSLDWSDRFRHEPVSKYDISMDRCRIRGGCHLIYWYVFDAWGI